MKSFGSWLIEIELESYAAVFSKNKINFDVVRSLSEADLRELGLALGDRKRLLQAVAMLDGQGDAEALPAPTAAATIAPLAPSAAPESPAGERRQLTVMFCDLVGSTALSEKLDPEELRSLLHDYRTRCGEVIARYEGFVARYVGDGILAYFGWPKAHEEDAERALRAALEIIQAVKRALSSEALSVRIGIATGQVVVGEPAGVGEQSKLAIGSTPNLAARLQGLAAADQIVIAASTRRLVGNSFALADLGDHELKGIAEPVHAWRVMALSTAASRFDASHGAQVTPMVGRDLEIGLMRERWELARSGEGQVVLLNGEPGIGKSRLLCAFRERLGDGIQIALQYQCSPYYTNTALYPIIDHLERALELRPDYRDEQKLDKLEQWLIGELGRGKLDCGLIARMLSISCESRYGPLEMSPQRQKDETLSSLVNIMAAVAKQQATVVLFEDAHWADPTTLEALSVLIDRTESLSLLVLITYRPEFQPTWTARSHVASIVLTRLSRAQSLNVVLRVAGGKPLPGDLVTQIVDKADGVPLFLEELAKAVLESGIVVEAGERYDYSGRVSKMTIPATLHDSLMARLDRLIPVKEIAQVGAALGREFDYELLSAVSPMKEPELTRSLDKLVESELVFRRGAPPQQTYVFKHALVQDAAYDSMLKAKRLQLHAQIAQVIEQRFPQKHQTQPELLAHHYTEANCFEQAIFYWQKAGELAQAQMALKEAIRHFKRGLELILQQPPSDRRDTLEFQLRTLLAMAWMAFQGYTHPEVLVNLQPALRLDRSRGEDNYTLRVIWGLWVYYFCVGQIEASLKWAERLIAKAEDLDNESMRIAGNWAACDSHLFLGNFAQTVRYADIILARYDAKRDRHMAYLIHHDPKSIALAFKAAAEWHLGYPDRAMASANAAIDNANQRKHAFDVCWVNVFVPLWVFKEVGNTVSFAACLEQCERLALEQGLPFFAHIWCPLNRGLLWLQSGRVPDACALLKEAIPRWLDIGYAIAAPANRTAYAEGLLKCNDVESAFSVLEQALEQIERPGWGERTGLSNTLRVKALTLQASGQIERAEATFLEALSVARSQQAKSDELRTATGYARFLRDQGKMKEALLLLQPIYGWFTEGFDTRDLREAKALLNELGECPIHDFEQS